MRKMQEVDVKIKIMIVEKVDQEAETEVAIIESDDECIGEDNKVDVKVVKVESSEEIVVRG